MSNVTAMEADKDHLFVRGATGATWTMTRAQIQTIFQAQSGTPAQRKTLTITAIRNSMITALGLNQVPAAVLDFDPADSLADLRLDLS